MFYRAGENPKPWLMPNAPLYVKIMHPLGECAPSNQGLGASVGQDALEPARVRVVRQVSLNVPCPFLTPFILFSLLQL